MKPQYIHNMDDYINRAQSVPILTAAKLCGFSSKQSDKGVECAGPCPCCGGTDRFAVVLRGPKTGVFNCRQCGLKGYGPIDLVKKIKNISFKEAISLLIREKIDPIPAQEVQPPDIAPENRKIPRSAMQLWASGIKWQGTCIEKYFIHRRILSPTMAPEQILSLHIENLRFIRKLPYYFEDKIIWEGPAMIGHIQDALGNIIGVHRSWLDPNLEIGTKITKKGTLSLLNPHNQKLLPAKKVLGHQKGGAIRIVTTGSNKISDFPGDLEGPKRLFLAEGIETLLSVYTSLVETKSHLIQEADFWCGLNLGNLASISIPPSTKEVIILADADSERGLTLKILGDASNKIVAMNKKCWVISAPENLDFNDILMK